MKYLLIIVLFTACNTNELKKLDNINLYNYNVEEKIKTLKITLSKPAKPVANYLNAVRTGDLVFLSGKGPRDKNGMLITGKLGKDVSVEEGYKAARMVGIAQLSALKNEIGDLNKVVRIVKVLGMVNADASFTNHPEVINGFSDLMVEVFGERGKHARAAVGMGSLPRNIVCEIEMIVQVKN
ncbi:MAG: RidA family protein [Flavobacteriaceae bacterium]|nr:RidA family protein [Flavobacteriaceae bacterium]